jgi:primary-amine oxidase
MTSFAAWIVVCRRSAHCRHSARLGRTSRFPTLGNPTSFQLAAGHSDISILADDEPQQQRAAFSGASFWVTRYHPDEAFAAGVYPNQNRKIEGLPAFLANHESIKNQDLVLWYTVGFRHQTRAEDWPVMPGLWHSFKIRPFNFFDRNPGMDVPPAQQARP